MSSGSTGRLVAGSFLAVVCCAHGVGCEAAIDTTSLQNGQCGAKTKPCDSKCVATDDPRTGCGLESCSPCNLPNAISRCGLDGKCFATACRTGFAHCSANVSDVCEQDIFFDKNHCGDCTHVCVIPNAIATCSNGVCQLASCMPGFAHCSANPDTGCETPTVADVNHCGSCTNQCTGSQTCVGSQCVTLDAGSG